METIELAKELVNARYEQAENKRRNSNLLKGMYAIMMLSGYIAQAEAFKQLATDFFIAYPDKTDTDYVIDFGERIGYDMSEFSSKC